MSLTPASAPPELVTGSLAEASVLASRALFRRCPVAVVVEDPGRGKHPLPPGAAEAAEGLGVPLLVAGDGLARELDRLGTDVVVTYGTPRGGWGPLTGDRRRVPGPRTLSESGDTGRDLAPALPPMTEPHGTPAALLLTGRTRPEDAAALVTARAAGARHVRVDHGDPRASTEAMTALRAGSTGRVVGVGAGLGPPGRFRSRVRMARAAPELPGGGVLLFPQRRMVALYGHPGTPALGVLGEQGTDGSIERVRGMAARYARISKQPIVPAWEIIATVAASAPGSDGNYSNESAVASLRPWVRAAGRAGIYVVLDLQPGRTDFLTQARRYEELLAEPHVGLALDPEWRLRPGERPLTRIGSVDIDEVNTVVAWLSRLVDRKQLPQKLLTLHQFRTDMLRHRSRLDTSHDELAILVHADGQGSQGQKQATWRAIRRGLPDGVWMGWKNFYDEDSPMLTPEQTMAQVHPTPWFISYQ